MPSTGTPSSNTACGARGVSASVTLAGPPDRMIALRSLCQRLVGLVVRARSRNRPRPRARAGRSVGSPGCRNRGPERSWSAGLSSLSVGLGGPLGVPGREQPGPWSRRHRWDRWTALHCNRTGAKSACAGRHRYRPELIGGGPGRIGDDRRLGQTQRQLGVAAVLGTRAWRMRSMALEREQRLPPQPAWRQAWPASGGAAAAGMAADSSRHGQYRRNRARGLHSRTLVISGAGVPCVTWRHEASGIKTVGAGGNR